jgi:hypothetical protein
MNKGLRLLGHPLHALLSDFPLVSSACSCAAALRLLPVNPC